MVKVLVLVKKVNAVVNMDGVERLMTIVVKDVNLNSENVNQPLLLQQPKLKLQLQPQLHLIISVVKVLDLAKRVNAVPNMDGVERPMITVVKDVNLNSENVNQPLLLLLLLLLQLKLILQLQLHQKESAVKDMVHVKKVNAVPSTDGVERQMTIVK